ncbi:MAG: response regulator [Desulfovibrionaceae bacterium]
MSRKVLIVDDDPHIRRLLEQTLESVQDELEFETLAADSGETGLRLIEQEKPDLVFLDVMMPGMDGFEVCRRVNGLGASHGSYIILLTARGQQSDRLKGLAAGAHRYLTKPFDPDDIVRLVESFFV